MRNRFDNQLRLLDEQLTRMGELCEVAIADAARALRENDVEKARAVIEADEEIDHIEKEIERLCLTMLLQQQPVASDLRRISSALKMITDMERIGDQTSDIAEIVITAKETAVLDVEEIGTMASAVSQMVHDSVSAYVEKNLELAQSVICADDIVDGYFDEIREELIVYIRNEQGHHGNHIFDLIMVMKYLERIGDHAVNIAEWVEFSITGVHKK